MSDWFVPRPVTQRDPKDPQALSHCWSAVGSWQLAAATDGASRVTAKAFAAAAGGGSGRKPGSGTQEDIVTGLAHYGVRGAIVRLDRQDAAELLGTDRRAVWAVATAYEKWPKALDCMGGTAGPDVNHAVGVIGGAPLQVMNPLCVGVYQTLPLATLLDAAFRYAAEQGHRRTIEVVRVYRQRPTGAIADKARIADLEDTIAEWQQYAAQVRRLANDILDVPVPK